MLSFLSPRLLASSYAKIAGWTLVAAVILFPFFVLQAVDQNGQLFLAPMTYRPYLLAVLGVFLGLCAVFFLPAPLRALGQSCPDFAVSDVQKKGLQVLLVVGLLLLPLVSNRAELDLATVVLLSVALAWGMTIVVGYAGLLDLGYIAFYAVGAYTYALLSTDYGVSFWTALPRGLFCHCHAGLCGDCPHAVDQCPKYYGWPQRRGGDSPSHIVGLGRGGFG